MISGNKNKKPESGHRDTETWDTDKIFFGLKIAPLIGKHNLMYNISTIINIIIISDSVDDRDQIYIYIYIYIYI